MSKSIASINVSTHRATFAALLGALVTGINTVLPGVDPFVVDGVTIARATLLARIQAALDAIERGQGGTAALQSRSPSRTRRSSTRVGCAQV